MIRLASLALFTLLGACSHMYVPAGPPNSWVQDTSTPASASSLSNASRTSFLYVTDRRKEDDTQLYGTKRSNAMVLGTAHVSLENMSVAEYSDYMSGSVDNPKAPKYALDTLEEIVRFPSTPLPFNIENGVLARNSASLKAYENARRTFRGKLADELRSRDTGKVVFYVHGFNTSFEHSVFDLMELAAASAWDGVPLLYSWPTGSNNILSYFADTQDGAFSVYHLKETLRLIAATEAVDDVTIIAHSHGASIVTTALRELLIETRGSGQSMRDTYRISDLILAAPDIDLGVMEQRLVAEQFGIGFDQINVYLNPDDNALGFAAKLLGAPRFGAMAPQEMSPESKAVFKGVKSVHFIIVEGAKGKAKHSHFRLHPGVLSDIAITIRTGAKPADPERPLEHLGLGFWRIDNTYRPTFRGDISEEGS
ncbi:MAG: alpha/beta hydrolase [Alphaproteobacteria bacterium]